jgi:hypothetical protein
MRLVSGGRRSAGRVRIVLERYIPLGLLEASLRWKIAAPLSANGLFNLDAGVAERINYGF